MKNRESASGNEKHCRRRFVLCSPGSATAAINKFYIHGTKWGVEREQDSKQLLVVSQEENSRIGKKYGLGMT
jgi:hypothetical protein